LVKNLIWLEKE